VGPYREAAASHDPCPRCAGPLAPRAIADAAIDECLSCQGVFVRNQLLDRFLDPLDLGGEVLAQSEVAAPALLSGGGRMYVKCPRCQTVMNRKQFATGARVVVDVCRDHGIWFDAAELRAVVAFADGGGMERAARRDAEQRVQEDEARVARATERWPFTPPSHTPHSSSTLLDEIISLLTGWPSSSALGARDGRG